MTDYNDDYYDDEPNEQEEMLFALIKQAKEQQERTNAVLERLTNLADKLEQGEQARNDKLDNALDKLADIDLQGIVSETTRQAVNELVVSELKQGVSQYVASQNATIERNIQALVQANNFATRNINSFADLIAKLKADETDLLEKQLAERVQLAVQKGVGKGLDKANNNINNFLIDIDDKLEQSERNVKQLNANIKHGAGEVVAELDEYREQVASRPKWLMALGWWRVELSEFYKR